MHIITCLLFILSEVFIFIGIYKFFDLEEGIRKKIIIFLSIIIATSVYSAVSAGLLFDHNFRICLICFHNENQETSTSTGYAVYNFLLKVFGLQIPVFLIVILFSPKLRISGTFRESLQENRSPLISTFKRSLYLSNNRSFKGFSFR